MAWLSTRNVLELEPPADPLPILNVLPIVTEAELEITTEHAPPPRLVALPTDIWRVSFRIVFGPETISDPCPPLPVPKEIAPFAAIETNPLVNASAPTPFLPMVMAPCATTPSCAGVLEAK